MQNKIIVLWIRGAVSSSTALLPQLFPLHTKPQESACALQSPRSTIHSEESALHCTMQNAAQYQCTQNHKSQQSPPSTFTQWGGTWQFNQFLQCRLDTGQQLDSLSANFTYKRCTLGTECTAHIKGAHLARDVLQLHAWGALAVQDQTPKTTTVSLCASTPLAKNTIQYCIFQYWVCTYSVFELGPFGSSSFLLSSTMPIKLTLTFIILHILHTETDLKFILLPQVNKAGCVDLCSLILLPLCSLRALTNKSGDNVSHRVKLKGTFSDLSSYDGFTPAHQGSILATL